MPHHFTKNTVEASAYCNTCNQQTMHYVADGRIGLCKEQHAKVQEAKLDPNARQKNLFNEWPI